MKWFAGTLVLIVVAVVALVAYLGVDWIERLKVPPGMPGWLNDSLVRAIGVGALIGWAICLWPLQTLQKREQVLRLEADQQADLAQDARSRAEAASAQLVDAEHVIGMLDSALRGISFRVVWTDLRGRPVLPPRGVQGAPDGPPLPPSLADIGQEGSATERLVVQAASSGRARRALIPQRPMDRDYLVYAVPLSTPDRGIRLAWIIQDATAVLEPLKRQRNTVDQRHRLLLRAIGATEFTVNRRDGTIEHVDQSDSLPASLQAGMREGSALSAVLPDPATVRKLLDTAVACPHARGLLRGRRHEWFDVILSKQRTGEPFVGWVSDGAALRAADIRVAELKSDIAAHEERRLATLREERWFLKGRFHNAKSVVPMMISDLRGRPRVAPARQGREDVIESVCEGLQDLNSLLVRLHDYSADVNLGRFRTPCDSAQEVVETNCRRAERVFRLPVILEADSLPELDEENLTLFDEFLSEALLNAKRHGFAAEVGLRLSVVQSRLQVTVENDGPPLRVDDALAKRHGLFWLKERLGRNHIGLRIEPRTSMRGCRLQASFPLKRGDENGTERVVI